MATDEPHEEKAAPEIAGAIGSKEKPADFYEIPVGKKGGLPELNIAPEILREMENLYARGASVEALASHFGIQEPWVRSLEKRYWLKLSTAVSEELEFPPSPLIFKDLAELTAKSDTNAPTIPALLDLPDMAVKAAEDAVGFKLAPHAKAAIAIDWAEAQETHRQMVFRKASEALAAAALPAPSSWKDAEIADKMARRAAGLDDRHDGPAVIIPINSAFSAGVERAV
jgi:hypothetical protein